MGIFLTKFYRKKLSTRIREKNLIIVLKRVFKGAKQCIPIGG